ncbi:crocetin glucosyltransferase, chloroplastic-like [Momordica charantia]|uniref:Mogroside I-E synthase n=1 Tax=Momordica charantia TaxID=3673 RepID=A0A6J1D1R7_MOMCH|nr:crocetin glucosyltransferase, chloroplastic-like [Momordica charantia]
MRNHHFLLISFPALGHINPSLQLADRLINLGVHVTFATTAAAIRRINQTQPPPPTLSLATISDGSDHQTTFQLDADDPTHYFSNLSRHGSQSLSHLITAMSDQDRPITFVIYSQLLTWAADVAATLDIPSALFFVQPATLLTLYHHYFHGHADKLLLLQHNPSSCVKLPGLPLLSPNDIPSFFYPSSPYAFVLPLLKNQLEFLHKQRHPKVLLNTFEELEEEALGVVNEFKMVAVGPLVPSTTSDSFVDTKDCCCCIEWLNSKAESSVVYVSFGSMCVLSDEQEAEIMDALVGSGYNFLWVKRCGENNNEEEEVRELLGGRGKIVRWCNQVQVLNHSSLGCFVTHCGWNSTLENLVYGVPVVAFPQQIDQTTNAKLVEDVWRTGVRVKPNTEGIVGREEIRRCLDIVMGDREVKKRGEIEGNVKKLKELAIGAIGEGGSSYLNLQTFVKEIDEGRF